MSIVSVLMPVYNREKFVVEAIQSILTQTWKDLELIVYDDGSTDNTVSLIEQIDDPRITLIKGIKNKGVSYARNQLLDACRTKYAAWQDSDDVSNVNRIDLQVKTILQGDIMVYTRYQKYPPMDIRENPRYLKVKHTANASAMFIVDKDIRFNEKLPIGEDVDWQYRMSQKYLQYFLDYILYYIRFHQDRLGVKYKGLDWEALR